MDQASLVHRLTDRRGSIASRHRVSAGRRWAWPAVAGLLAFAGAWAVGLAVTALIVHAIPPYVPHPTGDFGGFGDHLRAVWLLYLGAGLSLMVAAPVGCVTAVRVARRHVRTLVPNCTLS